MPDALARTDERITRLAGLSVAGLPSPHTRRIYASRIRQFLELGGELTRESIQEYLVWVRDEQGAGGVTVNQHLAAIKRLAEEAHARHILSDSDAHSIRDIRAVRQLGVRVGNWLTLDGLRLLIRAPDRTTVTGKRDAAVFALLAGCGLRRAEAATVEWARYQQREGRMCLVDVRGKGQRVRTIPVPEWARRDLDEWQMAGTANGGFRGSVPVVRAHTPGEVHVRQRSTETHEADNAQDQAGRPRPQSAHGVDSDGGKLAPRILGGLTESGVWWIVKTYSDQLGLDIRPHDLRRTIAHLMRKNGAQLEQISMFLGHSCAKTTQRYLGSGQELELGRAAVDKVEL